MYHLHVESKKERQKQKVEWSLPGAEWWMNWGDLVKGYKIAVRR